MANQIAGTIVWNLDIDDSKYNAALAKAKASAADLGKDVDSKMGGIKDSIVNSFQSATAASTAFAAGLGVVGAGLVAAAGFGVKYTADLETMRAGFVTLLGSTQKANDAITKIQKDAATTPFTFPGLVSANQLLTSVTKNSDESERLLLNVGKALTAMGKGQPELDRIIVNLQQIGAIGHANAVDIKQFAYAGIPIYDLLNEKLKSTKTAMIDNSKAIGDNNAKLQDLQSKLKVAQLQQSEFTNKTKESTKLLKANQIAGYTAQIQELTGKTGALTAQNGKLTSSQSSLDDAISSGKITFDLLKETFNEAGEAGGRFSKAFEEQGGTFNQVFSNLQDNIGITSSRLVTSLGIFAGAKKALVGLTDAAQYLASDAGIAKLNDVFAQLGHNLPIIVGLIVGGLTPAIVAAVTAFAPLIPFLAIGAAIGLLVKLLIDYFGGWAGAMVAVQNGLKYIGDIYNTYLKSSVDQLISQIKEAIPAFQRIWELIEPLLIPALKILGTIVGTVLVIAIKLIVEQLTFWLTVFNKIYKAIDNFASSAKKMVDSLSDIKDQFKKTLDASKDFVSKSLNDLQKWSEKGKDAFDNFVKGSQTTLETWGNNIGTALKPWHDNFLGTLGQTLTEAGNKIYQWDLERIGEYQRFGQRIGTALSSGAGALGSAIDNFMTQTLPAWGRGLQSWGIAVQTYFTSTLPNQVSTAAAQAGAAISGAVNGLFTQTIPAWIDGLGQWGQSIETYFTTTLPTQITTNVSGLWTAITTGISNIWTNVQIWWQNLGTQSADSISLGFLNQQPSMAGQIVGTILKVIGLVLLTLVVGLIEVGVRGAISMTLSIINGIKEGVPLVITAVTNLITSIKNEFDKMVKDAFDWGKNLLSSFGDGIKAAVGDLVQKASNALESAKKIFKGNSPPVTGPFQHIDDWGFNVGTAWVDGIKNAISGLSLDGPQLPGVGMMAAQPAYAVAGAGATGGGRTAPLINIENMSVRDDSDVTDIARELGFRIETSTGFTDNG